MYFSLALSHNRIPGTNVKPQSWMGDGKMDTPEKLAEQVIKALLNREISPQTRAALSKHLTEPPVMNANSSSVNPAFVNPALPRIVALVLGSPEFQRQ
jgi:hypothetical protein